MLFFKYLHIFYTFLELVGVKCRFMKELVNYTLKVYIFKICINKNSYLFLKVMLADEMSSGKQK